MQPAASQPHGIIPLPIAIERYFQVSLYLLVLTGFGTLASTGTLDAAAVLLVGLALLVRGYLLAKRTDVQIPAQWVNRLTLAYIAFYAADYFTLSGSFLTATVHLVLFGMVIRLFSAQKDRDHYMLAVLAFLMVLAAAVLTVNSVFFFAFAGFMLMATSTFVLMEMRRSSHAATIPARESTDPVAYRRMAMFLAGLSPTLVTLILAGAFAIFFLLPRMSAGYLGSLASGGDMAVGFSDRVQLGQIGQIQQSNSVVMHVQIDGDSRGNFDLQWRGVALGIFDGKSWSNRSEQTPVATLGPHTFDLGHLPTGPGVRSIRLIHYRVLMEPIGTNVFFLAGHPRNLTGNYRSVAADRAGSIYDLDSAHPVALYEADADVSSPKPDDLRAASGTVPPEIKLDYLQIPHLDQRIPQLAQRITVDADNNYDRAAAIEHYLMSNFGYTLQLPRTSPSDPLADFLFVRKQGHCEYFASAMAIMLRTLQIPARVVNGFRTTEFNDLTSNYVIRASSAHSWVEAYFPGSGWVTFDPTPGGGPSAGNTAWDRVLLYVDAAASFWREWVVNYDTSHQRSLGEDALRGSRSLLDRMRMWVMGHYSHWLEQARDAQKKVTKSPHRSIAIGILLGVLLVVAVNARRLTRWMRELRLKAHPEEAPSLAAALWYLRMTRWLGKQGWKKTPMQTPKEFLTRIEDPAIRERVEKFTRAYEAARFGESADHARRLPELYEEVTAPERRSQNVLR
jgi:protein-glutamine gamma-glutamyltransferase